MTKKFSIIDKYYRLNIIDLYEEMIEFINYYENDPCLQTHKLKESVLPVMNRIYKAILNKSESLEFLTEDYFKLNEIFLQQETQIKTITEIFLEFTDCIDFYREENHRLDESIDNNMQDAFLAFHSQKHSLAEMKEAYSGILSSKKNIVGKDNFEELEEIVTKALDAQLLVENKSLSSLDAKDFYPFNDIITMLSNSVDIFEINNFIKDKRKFTLSFHQHVFEMIQVFTEIVSHVNIFNDSSDSQFFTDHLKAYLTGFTLSSESVENPNLQTDFLSYNDDDLIIELKNLFQMNKSKALGNHSTILKGKLQGLYSSIEKYLDSGIPYHLIMSYFHNVNNIILRQIKIIHYIAHQAALGISFERSSRILKEKLLLCCFGRGDNLENNFHKDARIWNSYNYNDLLSISKIDIFSLIQKCLKIYEKSKKEGFQSFEKDFKICELDLFNDFLEFLFNTDNESSISRELSLGYTNEFEYYSSHVLKKMESVIQSNFDILDKYLDLVINSDLPNSKSFYNDNYFRLRYEKIATLNLMRKDSLSVTKKYNPVYQKLESIFVYDSEIIKEADNWSDYDINDFFNAFRINANTFKLFFRFKRSNKKGKRFSFLSDGKIYLGYSRNTIESLAFYNSDDLNRLFANFIDIKVLATALIQEKNNWLCKIIANKLLPRLQAAFLEYINEMCKPAQSEIDEAKKTILSTVHSFSQGYLRFSQGANIIFEEPLKKITISDLQKYFKSYLYKLDILKLIKFIKDPRNKSYANFCFCSHLELEYKQTKAYIISRNDDNILDKLLKTNNLHQSQNTLLNELLDKKEEIAKISVNNLSYRISERLAEYIYIRTKKNISLTENEEFFAIENRGLYREILHKAAISEFNILYKVFKYDECLKDEEISNQLSEIFLKSDKS